MVSGPWSVFLCLCVLSVVCGWGRRRRSSSSSSEEEQQEEEEQEEQQEQQQEEQEQQTEQTEGERERGTGMGTGTGTGTGMGTGKGKGEGEGGDGREVTVHLGVSKCQTTARDDRIAARHHHTERDHLHQSHPFHHPRRGTVCDLSARPDHHITHTHT